MGLDGKKNIHSSYTLSLFEKQQQQQQQQMRYVAKSYFN